MVPAGVASRIEASKGMPALRAVSTNAAVSVSLAFGSTAMVSTPVALNQNGEIWCNTSARASTSPMVSSNVQNGAHVWTTSGPGSRVTVSSSRAEQPPSECGRCDDGRHGRDRHRRPTHRRGDGGHQRGRVGAGRRRSARTAGRRRDLVAGGRGRRHQPTELHGCDPDQGLELVVGVGAGDRHVVGDAEHDAPGGARRAGARRRVLDRHALRRGRRPADARPAGTARGEACRW